MGDIMTAIIDKLRAFGAAFLVVAALSGSLCPAYAQGQTQRPNIVFIMGDDIGWANIGVPIAQLGQQSSGTSNTVGQMSGADQFNKIASGTGNLLKGLFG